MLGTLGDETDLNGFADIPESSVDTLTNRVVPRQVQSGVTRGTQTIMNTDGSYVTLGQIPDGGTSFGIAFFDAGGNLISKNTGATQYVYDITTGKNVIQIGKLPDGTYGFAVAASGYNVSDGFS